MLLRYLVLSFQTITLYWIEQALTFEIIYGLLMRHRFFVLTFSERMWLSFGSFGCIDNADYLFCVRLALVCSCYCAQHHSRQFAPRRIGNIRSGRVSEVSRSPRAESDRFHDLFDDRSFSFSHSSPENNSNACALRRVSLHGSFFFKRWIDLRLVKNS